MANYSRMLYILQHEGTKRFPILRHHNFAYGARIRFWLTKAFLSSSKVIVFVLKAKSHVRVR